MLLILNGLLIFGVLSWSFNQQFEDYLETADDQRRAQLVTLAADLYKNYEGWTLRAMEVFSQSSLLEGYRVQIWDQEGTRMFAADATHTAMNGMHGQMMRNMMGRRTDTGSLKIELRDIRVGNAVVGRMEIGYYEGAFFKERDVAFQRSLVISIIVSLLLSVVLALFIAGVSSKPLVKPLKQMRDAAHKLREGQLDITLPTPQKTTELDELAGALNYLSASLHTQKKLRQQMASDLSHELRTPLTVLRSHLDAIYEGIWELDADRVGVLQAEIQRLMDLADQVKYMEDIEQDQLRLQIEPVNVNDFLREVYTYFQPKFMEKEIDFILDVTEHTTMIKMDKVAMRQVVTNFLTNALQYTPSGGQVHLGITDVEGHGTLYVQDTGIGIAEEDIPFIFERLYRATGSSEYHQKGAGIGLAVAKSIVTAHKGNIQVESTVGQGTRFTIVFKHGEVGSSDE